VQCIRARLLPQNTVTSRRMYVSIYVVSNYSYITDARSVEYILESDFGAFCVVYVQRRSLFFLRIPLLDTTCFGLTGHLQVYRLYNYDG
jgi:hypothetical protein